MRHTRAHVVAVTVLGTTILFSALFSSAAAFAAPTPTSRTAGVVHVFAESNGSKPGRVVLTGAIGDSGTTTNVNAKGRVDVRGTYVRLKLKAGTVESNLTTLYKLTDSATPTFSPTTCSVFFGATSASPLIDGTGAYRGISGSVTLTFTVAAVLPRYASGKNKGQCHTTGTPTGEQVIVTGSGPISFSG